MVSAGEKSCFSSSRNLVWGMKPEAAHCPGFERHYLLILLFLVKKNWLFLFENWKSVKISCDHERKFQSFNQKFCKFLIFD